MSKNQGIIAEGRWLWNRSGSESSMPTIIRSRRTGICSTPLRQYGLRRRLPDRRRGLVVCEFQYAGAAGAAGRRERERVGFGWSAQLCLQWVGDSGCRHGALKLWPVTPHTRQPAARGSSSVPRCDPRPVEHGGQGLASHRIGAVLRMFLCLPAATAIRSRFLRWLSARTMISVDDGGP